MSTQEITIPTTVTTIDTVFAASALTYLVTLYGEHPKVCVNLQTDVR